MLNRAIKELQMITGVVTNDIDYLMYLMLYKQEQEAKEKKKIEYEQSAVKDEIVSAQDLDCWFKGLQEV